MTPSSGDACRGRTLHGSTSVRRWLDAFLRVLSLKVVYDFEELVEAVIV